MSRVKHKIPLPFMIFIYYIFLSLTDFQENIVQNGEEDARIQPNERRQGQRQRT